MFRTLKVSPRRFRGRKPMWGSIHRRATAVDAPRPLPGVRAAECAKRPEAPRDPRRADSPRIAPRRRDSASRGCRCSSNRTKTMVSPSSAAPRAPRTFRRRPGMRDENPARSQGGNMIYLDRPTPTAGLAFSTPFLYSLQHPRLGRPVRSRARSNLFPGLRAGPARSGAVSKRNRLQANVYEGP